MITDGGFALMIYYINSAISIGMMHYAFTRIFKPVAKNWQIMLVYTAYLVISSQAFIFFENAWLNLALNIIFFIAITFLYSGRIGTKLVFTTLIYVLHIAADIISFMGTSYLYYDLHGAALTLEYAMTVGRTGVNVIYLPLLLVGVIIFRKLFMRKISNKTFKAPHIHTIAVFLMLLGIIALNILYTWTAMSEIQVRVHQIVTSQFIVIAIIFLIIWLYNAVLEHLETLEKSRLKDQMLERWEIQYQAATYAQKAIGEVKHNLKFHFLALSAFLKEGEIEKADEYIEDKLGELSYVVNSGNMSIDAMINYYQQRIRDALNIELKTKISIPAQLKLDANLVVTTLGNAFENAMDACEHVEQSQRFIQTKMTITPNGSLFIVINNPYTVAPIVDKEGKLQTTKPEPYKHGVGLASVMEMLPSEVGQVHIEYSDNVFQFMVQFYDVLK